MIDDHIISREKHAAWFDGRTERGDDLWLFCMDGRPWGATCFTDFDKTARSCAWGFYIGAPDAAKGAGSVLGCLSMEYIFNERDIVRIKSQVLAPNAASAALHKNLLFVETGRALGKIKRPDGIHDLIFFELAKGDWEKGKAAVWQAALERLGRGARDGL
jgi:RimJ/RimL family protein N-acetyltransferase